MKSRTPYQQKLIRNYYQNRDAIMLQTLSEIVSELYIAPTERRRAQLWSRAEKALRNLDYNKAEIAQVLESRDEKALAKLVSRAF